MSANPSSPKTVDCFIGPFRWLSNFHLKAIFWRGLWFSSTEAGYQFTKGIGVEAPENLIRFHSPREIGGKILSTYTPVEVKREGRKIKCREDWEQIKYAVMLLLNIEKYSTFPERQLLLATDGLHLREGNWWHDNTWGDCIFGSRNDALLYMKDLPFAPCLKCAKIEGKNWLGKIAMQIRLDIKHDEKYIIS